MYRELTDKELLDLDNRFKHHPPSAPDAAENHGKVRELLKCATAAVLMVAPPSRESALFITKMEEAMFWANAAIARNQGEAKAPLLTSKDPGYFCDVCPHAVHFHNPDGSCGCGIDCAAVRKGRAAQPAKA